MKISKGGVWIHRYKHKGCIVVKIKYMVTSHYFIIRKVALIGVSDHCVRKIKRIPFPHEYIYFKVLWNIFHILHWICKSYGIPPPPPLLADHNITDLLV